MARSAGVLLKKKGFIKREMDMRLSKAQSDAVWARAEEILAGILREYEGMPSGERLHADGFIFPSAAVYKALGEEIGAAAAYELIESAAVRMSTTAGQKLARAMRLPFLRGAFMRFWSPLTKKMFGPKQGFRNVFYPAKKGEFRMDITACPYCKYLAALGCPELTKIFCANDDRCYGNLPGLEFRRRGTLGTGADRCDFYIRRI